MNNSNETPRETQTHFVLCQADKSPGPEPHKKRWRDYCPTPEEVEQHLAADLTHKVGIVPASIGLFVIDCDGGCFQQVQDDLRAQGVRFHAVPSSTEGNGHLWMRAEDPAQWAGNSHWGDRDDPTRPHGEVRSDMGYAAFKDRANRDALLAVANSIPATSFTREQLDAMYGPPDEVETKREAPPKRQRGPRRAPSVEELRDQFEHIPLTACDNYETWQRMVAAAKYECGEPGREVTRQWSMRSGKYDSKDFDSTWASFKRTSSSGKVATWGSLVHEANGYNAMARIGWENEAAVNGEPNVGGRPRHDDPSPGARKGRAVRASATLNDLLLDTDAPEQSDAYRVLNLCKDQVMLVNSASGPIAMVRTSNGLWIDLEHRRTDAATGALAVVLKKARDLALKHGREQGYDPEALQDIADFWKRGDTARAKGELARQLSQQIAGGEVKVKTMHERQLNMKGRLIPLIDQPGAWLVNEGRTLTPDEAAEYHATEMGWGIPTPEDESSTEGAKLLDETLKERYHDLWQRSAAWIGGTAKAVDMVIAHRSSWGKTTFFELLSLAFPGMVEIGDARTIYNKGSIRFTPTARHLATKAVYMLDEVGHLENELPVSLFNSHTDTFVTVERKGKDACSQHRVGTLVLAGHKEPPINTTAQGIDTRVHFIHEVREDAESMSQEMRDTLMKTDGVASRLRWQVLSLAKAFHDAGKDPWTETVKERHEEAVAKFMQAGVPGEIQVLHDEFEEGNEHSWTAASEIEATLRDYFGAPKRLASKTVGSIVKKAFPKAKKTRGSGDQRPWGYSGIARVTAQTEMRPW